MWAIWDSVSQTTQQTNKTNKNYHHKIIGKLKEKAAIKRLLIIITMEIYSEGITKPQNV